MKIRYIYYRSLSFLNLHKIIWKNEINRQVKRWERLIEKIRLNKEEYQFRIDPYSILQPELAALLSEDFTPP